MTALDHTEAAFETLIVSALTADGRWVAGDPADYDAQLGLYPADVVEFVGQTQPKNWAKLVPIAGGEAKARYSLLKRLAGQLDKRGTVEVLRNGFSERGIAFSLCQLRPAHSLDEATEAAYEANRLRVVRQVRFDPRKGDSVDLVLFVNGVPTATAELKNRWTGQSVEQAITQYRHARPRERAACATRLRPLRDRRRACLHDHPPGRRADALSALQPGLGRRPRARARRRAQLPDPALRGLGQDQGDRVALPRALLAAYRCRRQGLLQGDRDHRPPGARPPLQDRIRQFEQVRYAIVVDEAHSSQTGDSAADLKVVLGSTTPEELDLDEDDGTPPALLARLAARRRQPNLSFFAFTATPKGKTLELFGEYGQTEATPTDPNVLFDAAEAVRAYDVIEDRDLQTFSEQWSSLAEVEEDRRHAVLSTSTRDPYERALALEPDERRDLKDALARFIRTTPSRSARSAVTGRARQAPGRSRSGRSASWCRCSTSAIPATSATPTR
ncbi:MAG: type I restriction endonuclease [Thermoleophilaceae bacterium]